MVLERTRYRDGVREIDLVSDEERDAMYGMPVAEIKDSPGLNVDIAFITNFHARFERHFQIQRITVPAIDGCRVCGGTPS